MRIEKHSLQGCRQGVICETTELAQETLAKGQNGKRETGDEENITLLHRKKKSVERTARKERAEMFEVHERNLGA